MANNLPTQKKVAAVSMLAEGNGRTAWQGEVEVFDIAKHPKAKRCYTWSLREGQGDSRERFVAVLEIPPVESPESAVCVSIVADVKKKSE